MINKAKALTVWIRSQSADSLIVLVVMIIMEIVMLPIVVGIVIWIYISRLLRTLGGKLAVKR